MKKFISILLCVALLCSMVVFAASADGDPQMSVANATVLQGSTVTLDIDLLNNPGIASLGLDFIDNNGLDATYAGADADGDDLGLTANDAMGSYFWVGPTNSSLTTMGTMTLTIPVDAKPGNYTFDVIARDSVNATGDVIDIAATTFTITVVDKLITGVNVAIDAGLSIGIHVLTVDPDDTSITAVDLAGEKYTTVADYEEDEENGGYIYYLNVNPWDMDKEFLVDFTDKFVIEDEKLSLVAVQLPKTAKSIGILSYCEKIQGTSDELDQLIADLLEFGRQSQIYQDGAATLTLPDGLAATEAAWENGDGDPCTFADYCSENFPEDITGKNATAKKKFEFDQAEINFGSKFVVTFTFKNGATTTASNLARVKANGETYQLDGWNLTYAFSPAEYAGTQFDLYAAANTNNTNWAWINVYGPAHYAAYLNDTYGEDAAEILAILEAFYNYGVSVENYVATLGE